LDSALNKNINTGCTKQTSYDSGTTLIHIKLTQWYLEPHSCISVVHCQHGKCWLVHLICHIPLGNRRIVL
jgi:hypothetical protein